ncbi:unnamed protein product [Caenorhabditis angaria]|uniref:Uncharacterized protein n=1 Tax=Caenorhabditis angaria TaxID=860376 RepID=A0A9P1IW20_9PELO|nr:unnamed protein product [Caenorhabditis angaria]
MCCIFAVLLLFPIFNVNSIGTNYSCSLESGEIFNDQADFGYLAPRLPIHKICQGNSELVCSDELTFCTGKNIFFDFSNLKISQKSARYRDDVIGPGNVGGFCNESFDKNLLDGNLNYPGYLTSWSDELKHFVSVENAMENCDVIFEKPTILMKLDAANNMYHHFCDFINLYASLHINQSFSQDGNVIWWDTHPEGYLDQMFGITWKAFSNNTPIELKSLDQKKVCFKNVMLPLLARQRDGLFYNSPIVPECSKSELFSNFSDFILDRLLIPKHQAELEKVRIVILSRSTSYRRILNIREVSFSKILFKK